MKKWPGDAQPEWPKVASPTQQVPAFTRETQVFPETGARAGQTREDIDVAVPDSGETDVLEGAHGARRRPRGTSADSGGIPTPAGPPAEETTSALRDPWGGSGESGNAFDPHEVTVQLDGVSRQLDGMSADAGAAGPGVQDGSDGPVFVDESGRRSRRFRRIGIALGLACAVYAVVIVATLLSGSSDAPWLPVPGQKDDTPAGKVDTSTTPSPSVLPSGTGAGELGATPSTGDGTTPDATTGATAPGATASGSSGTSADPKPSTSTSTKGSSTTTGGSTTTTGGTSSTGSTTSGSTTGSTTTGSTTGSTTTDGGTTTGTGTTGDTGTTTGTGTTGDTGTTTGTGTTGDTGTTTSGDTTGTTTGSAASLRSGTGTARTRSAVTERPATPSPVAESGTLAAPTYI